MRIQEFGATITHPGGTKYINDAAVGGKYVGTRFVDSSFSGEHKVTGEHTIVIPPRPFMRLAYANFSKGRKAIQKQIADKLLAGDITPPQALSQIALALEGYIIDAIKNGGWAPNASSTVRNKGFNKPLIDSSQAWQGVTSQVVSST